MLPRHKKDWDKNDAALDLPSAHEEEENVAKISEASYAAGFLALIELRRDAWYCS